MGACLCHDQLPQEQFYPVLLGTDLQPTKNLKYEPSLDQIPDLALAAAEGRYVAALGELRRLKNNGGGDIKGVDAASIERVKRIGSIFEAGMELIKKKPTDLKISEENSKLKLSWGVKIEGDRMSILSVTDLSALSFVDCCVLEFERDLENYLSDDEINATMLSTPHIHDCTWRRITHSKSLGTKADDILVESAIDALDEPYKSVFSMRYSPSAYDPAASVDPYGNVLPTAEKGHDRSAYCMVVTKLTPSGTGAIRTEAVEVKLPSTIAKLLGLMPGFLLKELFRGSLENLVKYTLEFAEKHRAVLDEKMQTLPRSEFYDRLRSRAR